MTTNISGNHPEVQLSKLLAVIGQPARIQILFVIGAQDTCVCHLEAALGMRQAAISQHLMVLRKAGLVAAHRDGRHVFYRLASPAVVDLLRQAALLTGIPGEALEALALRPVGGCTCPHCNPELDSGLTCRDPKTGKILM